MCCRVWLFGSVCVCLSVGVYVRFGFVCVLDCGVVRLRDRVFVGLSVILFVFLLLVCVRLCGCLLVCLT